MFISATANTHDILKNLKQNEIPSARVESTHKGVN